MLSPRWRKVFRDLWSYKSRTLLAILSIAVGVVAVGNILAGSAVISREMTAEYLGARPAQAELYTYGVDRDLLASLERVEGVGAVEGRSSYWARANVGPDEWRQIELTAASDLAAMQINVLDPKRGEWPSARREIALERSALALLKVDVGDTLLLEAGDGTRRELIVTGVLHDVTKFPSNFTGTAYGYVDIDTLTWLGYPTEYTRVLVRLVDENPTQSEITTVAEAVEKKIERAGLDVWSIRVPTPGKHPTDEIISPVIMLLGVLGLLALGLSAFLVINTVSAILSQQIRQIGMMKAVGARRGQIARLYLGMVLVLGGMALAIAIPLGHWLARGSTEFLASFINIDIASHAVPAPIYAIEIAIGLLVPLLATVLPVRAGTRITVREAVNAYGLSSGGARRGLVDRLLLRVRGISRPLLMSLRNTFRRKARLTLTLITLVMAGAIFCAVQSVRASLLDTLDDALAYWDHEVTLNLGRAYRVDQLEQEALAVPGVVAAESWDFGQAERVRADDSHGETLFIVAPPAQTDMIAPILLAGRWLLPDDENAIVINTEVLKVEPDIAVGDQIVLAISTGSEPLEQRWTVVGIVKGLMTGRLVYVNYPYYSRLMGRVDRASSVRVQLAQKDGASQRNAAKALERHFRARGIRVNNWNITDDLRAQVVNQLMVIVQVLFGMALLLAIVGALGLMGTMGINVLERTREIGVMRAIGASDGAVSQIVVVEGVLIGILSWVMGALLAFPLSRAINAMLGAAVVRSSLNQVYSWQGAMIWLGVVIVLSALASWAPARRATQLTVRDVLAYEG